MKAPLWGILRYVRQLLDGSRANMEMEGARTRSQDISPYLAKQPLHVLDLANGSLRPQYLILQAQGHQVYGVDWINGASGTPTALAYALARCIYAHQLRLSRNHRPQTLVCANVAALPFGDARFDLITSVAAFEHFLDVPRVLSEMHRVLCPGGVIWTCVHLFTSPSGGHNLGYPEIPLRRLPPGVAAWDHLRARRLPFTVPLNEWRRDQYRAAFAQRFSILKEYCWVQEGEHFLTPQLKQELGGYDDQELTCGAYVLVARKDS